MQLPLELLSGAQQFGLNIHARGVAGAPKVVGGFRKFGFERVGTGYEATVNATDFRPQLGAALRFPAATQAQAYVALHEGERYALAEIPLKPASKPRVIPRSIGLLWDASASARKRDREGEFALLDRCFAAMGTGRVHLRLLRDVGEDGGSFDNHGGNWSALRKTLETAVLDGASNLADWTPQPGINEYLLVSDGLHNYGGGAFPALAPHQRLYALASGGAQADHGRLTALAQSRGGRLVAWQGSRGLESAARALLEDGVRVVGMRGDGIADLVAQSRFVDDGILRVAGRLTEPDAMLRITLDMAGTPHDITLPVAATAAPLPQAAQAWATWKVATLSAEPELHRAGIERLGKAFSLVTANTSLLVLDELADYVRYDIPAPPALQAQVAELRAVQAREREETRGQRLDKVAGMFAKRIDWWQRDFPKGALPKPELKETHLRPRATAQGAQARPSVTPPPPPEEPPVVFDEPSPVDAPRPSPAPPAPMLAEAAASTLDSVTVTFTRMSDASDASASPQGAAVIRLQAWEPDSPYARRLRDAPADRLYALYLDERDSHAESTAFYLDVADLLLKHGRSAEALRVGLCHQVSKTPVLK